MNPTVYASTEKPIIQQTTTQQFIFSMLIEGVGLLCAHTENVKSLTSIQHTQKAYMLGFSSLFAQLEKNHPMPKWGYTITELDPETTVKSSGRELSISHKAAREVCKTIKGMTLDQAKEHLNKVIQKKQPIPFRRYKKKAGHRHGLEKTYAGRYPVKAAQKILKVLQGAEANAENKGLDIERLKIIHAVAYPGIKIKRFTIRAFGRSSPKFQTLTHVELVLEQTEETPT